MFAFGSESRGEVGIVFVLTVNRETPKIVIEKWEPEPQGNWPHRIQQVTVYREDEGGRGDRTTASMSAAL